MADKNCASGKAPRHYVRFTAENPPLHVKDAMGKCVYHISVAVCLLLGIVGGKDNHICRVEL